ncbi:SH3 domain-containing protein [Tropicimonas marinistellae]|uniref:SH3 domain-containing protein n=1 Tax=Tropicimonas marinistellae TaxID=1739787 RepID=UPI00082D9551|nr:SH3 domain-containing protein [Tropicimonas marinistellae]
MLGRYVAGTLLVLGVAMLMAPPAEDDTHAVAVTRADTAPSTLIAPDRQTVSKPPVALVETTSTRSTGTAEPSVPEPTPASASPGGVEAAVMEALNLDESEQVDLAQEEDAGVGNGAAILALAGDSLAPSGQSEGGVLAGLSDPGFFAVGDGGRSAAQEEAQQAQATLLYVTGTRVNVRAGPSTAYRVVGTVARGDLVELVSYEGADWARVRTSEGTEPGFMSRSFLARSLGDG